MKLSIEKLREIQAKNLPTATPAIWNATMKSDTPEAREAFEHLRTYLAQFLPPGKCVGCESPLGADDVVSALLTGASFRWGIAWGEGECARCGWPARAHHVIEPPGIEVQNFILQYHPSLITVGVS